MAGQLQNHKTVWRASRRGVCGAGCSSTSWLSVLTTPVWTQHMSIIHMGSRLRAFSMPSGPSVGESGDERAGCRQKVLPRTQPVRRRESYPPVANPLPSYFHLHLVSDSTGETLTTIAKAAAVQYAMVRPIEHV